MKATSTTTDNLCPYSDRELLQVLPLVKRLDSDEFAAALNRWDPYHPPRDPDLRWAQFEERQLEAGKRELDRKIERMVGA